MKITNRFSILLLVASAMPAAVAHAQTDLVVTPLVSSSSDAPSANYSVSPVVAPMQGVDETADSLTALPATEITPPVAIGQPCINESCECHQYLRGQANHLDACDGKGHMRRYGYPYCMSGNCLSAAPYGNPHAFSNFQRPFGSLLRGHFGQQVRNGVAARLILHQYDFHRPDTEQRLLLNAHGRDRLMKLGELMSCYSCPLIIEESGDPDLDEQRRQLVATVLQSMQLVPDAFQQVRVGSSLSRGLDGSEAIQVYQNMLINTQTAGSLRLYGIEESTTR